MFQLLLIGAEKNRAAVLFGHNFEAKRARDAVQMIGESRHDVRWSKSFFVKSTNFFRGLSCIATPAADRKCQLSSVFPAQTSKKFCATCPLTPISDPLSGRSPCVRNRALHWKLPAIPNPGTASRFIFQPAQRISARVLFVRRDHFVHHRSPSWHRNEED